MILFHSIGNFFDIGDILDAEGQSPGLDIRLVGLWTDKRQNDLVTFSGRDLKVYNRNFHLVAARNGLFKDNVLFISCCVFISNLTGMIIIKSGTPIVDFAYVLADEIRDDGRMRLDDIIEHHHTDHDG